MQIKGNVNYILPIQSGTSAKGEWKKRDIVILTDGEYPKNVCVSIWNKLLDIPIKEGIKVSAEIDIIAKEYKGKWYNEVKAWKLDLQNVTKVKEIVTEETLPF